ncbi:MAG TPA: hypothetical protein VJL28_05060 [Gemmatimonadaceae bacterium]|nr:hypothetical protein [Gemmatimonadaceae bacterium]
MRRAEARLVLGVGLALIASVALAQPARAQLPLAPVKASGQAVTPVFEGWYRNPDGTFSISFGYFNRNAEESVEIPIGPDNFIEPGDSSQGQPTRFHARRHWGVFAVRVPADFGTKKVVWTLRIRGATNAIPGSLHRDWQIDALEGEAGSDNTPPALKFAENGPEGRGPGGIAAGPFTTPAGTPLPLTVWATDDGKMAASASGATRAGIPVTLTWFKHQGPGDVTFSQPTVRLTPTGGKATTTATFSKPGDYILRVRANDSAVAGAGHAQCCWTNGFLKVTVTK